ARILVAPLDWGLGHAARCVPVIKALLAHRAVPILGADGGPMALLRQEFPALEHVRIPGAVVRYGRGSSQLWSMTRQFPAMIRSVRAEHALLERLKQQLQLDAVISDQRFGLRSDDMPSVLITHQVFPFTPIAQGALRKFNGWQISRFDRCWVMDEAAAPGLAGDLSHGGSLPTNARYIGVVSRFDTQMQAPVSRGFRVVAVISGPEPQRTLLEAALLSQLQHVEGDHLLVQGLPAKPGDQQVGNVRMRSHLSGPELQQALLGAELIISRSGYTTLMDLASIGRSALIIPTPGQPEQEYLGALHARTGRFLVQKQSALNVADALQRVLPEQHTRRDLSALEQALKDLAALMGR
ncbi:MAG: hypothetical protein IT229_07235, partial [Flavobacteriales bacterium]|nr:hypothetical protein [Flavobacteriales bacterium]